LLEGEKHVVTSDERNYSSLADEFDHVATATVAGSSDEVIRDADNVSGSGVRRRLPAVNIGDDDNL